MRRELREVIGEERVPAVLHQGASRLCDRVVDGEAAVIRSSDARTGNPREGCAPARSGLDGVGSASGGLPLVAVPAPLAIRRQLTDVRIVARVLVVAPYLMAVLLGRRFPLRAVPPPLTVG